MIEVIIYNPETEEETHHSFLSFNADAIEMVRRHVNAGCFVSVQLEKGEAILELGDDNEQTH